MKSSVPHFEEVEPFFHELTETARSIAMQYFATSIVVEHKADQSPVTIADKKIEDELRRQIMAKYPAHGILGEEQEDHNPEAAIQWVIDPIDGTKSFISGIPFFSTLIGVVHNNQPMYGCLALPCEQKVFTSDGETLHLNGNVFERPAIDAKIERAVLITTDERDMIRLHPQLNYRELCDRVSFVRTWGDAYGYAMVLEGRAQFMLDAELSPWDILPLMPVLKAAGLTCTSLNGGDPVKEAHMICAEPSLHSEALQLLTK